MVSKLDSHLDRQGSDWFVYIIAQFLSYNVNNKNDNTYLVRLLWAYLTTAVNKYIYILVITKWLI